MKSTGILRTIDNLGRIVLPIELRRHLSIGPKDSVEIFVEKDSVVLKKHQPNCAFCGSEKNVAEFKGKFICKDCIKELNK